MKKCDHFRDLIRADYIDGELDKDSAGTVESHLLDCGDCRAFLKEVKNNAVIFPVSCLEKGRSALQQPVPAELWDMIKQRIEHENQTESPLSDLIERLKGVLVFPRLVPVFASLMLMFLAGSVTLNTIQVQQSRDKDQGEYLVSLLSPAEVSAVSDNTEGGTPIEHYFL